MTRNTSLLILVAATTGCFAHVPPRYCAPAGSQRLGASQAMRGEPINYAAGAACPVEARAAFEQNLKRGYDEGRRQHCTPAAAQQLGAVEGRRGAPATFPGARYAICENRDELRAAFESGHRLGAVDFCTQDLSDVGRQLGLRGEANVFPLEHLSTCSPEQQETMRRDNEAAYREALAEFCRGDRIHEHGYADGSAGRARASVHADYRLCAPTELAGLQARYQDSYLAGLRTVCSADVITTAAHQTADDGEFSSLPGEYDRCFQEFPNLVQVYRRAWSAERERIVADELRAQAARDRAVAEREAELRQRRELRAYDTCRDLGYSRAQCRGVTSKVCLDTGYAPALCRFPDGHHRAIDVCLRHGYAPQQCREVTSGRCIKEGYAPSRCR